MKLNDLLQADDNPVDNPTADHIETQAATPPSKPPIYNKIITGETPPPPKQPKHPFKDMNVGDYVDIPLDPQVARNERDPAEQLKQRFKTMRNRLHQEFSKVKRTAFPGSKFQIEAKPEWLRVWRTK